MTFSDSSKYAFPACNYARRSGFYDQGSPEWDWVTSEGSSHMLLNITQKPA